MPDVSDAPKRNIKVQSLFFPASLPYEEGHSLNGNEAASMNQTRCENLRNNFAAKINKACAEYKDEKGNPCEASALPEDVKTKLMEQFVAYDEVYEFGQPGGRETDPVKSQALQLATPKVKAALKKAGHDLKEVGSEKIRALAEQAIEKNPKFMERARIIVDARSEADSELSVDLA